jgi:hypothetical protein
MVTKGAALDPGCLRLLGREVAGLRLGKLIEAIVIDMVRHSCNCTVQTSDMPLTR